jgi:signal transduction histidine kinase
VILSTIQLLKKFNDDSIPVDKDKNTNYIEIVSRNSNNLLKVINNLIDTSKIESGQYKLNLEDVDIVYLVEETVLSMKDYVESHGLELIIDTEVEEKLILCDSVEIERCIINLVSNAVKFTPRGGTVWVNIYDMGSKVQISVKDNGIGIAQEHHEKVFDRFGQIENPIISTKVGSGIGLTLVRSLVELHGGSINIISELGKGSEFIITI